MKNKSQIKIGTYSLEHISTLSILGTFAIILPMLIHQQWLTGPIINALLLTTCVLIGSTEAIFIGLLPSTVALSSGLLPLPLAPMLPFIIISNALFVTTFNALYKKNFTLGVITASIVKFIFLYAFTTFLAQNLLAAKLLPQVSHMLTYPQLATALLGGLLAYLTLKVLKRT